MVAFTPTGSPFAPRKHKMGRYDDYDISALTGEQNTAPAGPGQPASQGALSGEASPEAAPVLGALGEGEARKPEGQDGTDFYSMFRSGSDDEREAMTRNVLEPLESKGVSAEGAAKMMWEKNPQLATEIGAKFGIVPPADKAGMPGFKTQEQALLDYESDKKKAAEEKARLKKEKRHAMGGFLFEMGLRILASNRPDAGGAIGEGALGTIEARSARKKAAKAEGIADEDREYILGEREYQAGEREEAGTDRTRRRASEDEAEKRAKSEEKRRQEEHEAKLKSGGYTARGARGPTAFEVQWGFYKKAFGDEAMKKEEEQALRQKFLSYYNRESKMTVKEKEAMISNFIKLNDDNPDDAWFDLNANDKRQAAIDAMGLEDKDADSDPLGLRSK